MNSDDETKHREAGLMDESGQSEDILKYQDGAYNFSYGKVTS